MSFLSGPYLWSAGEWDFTQTVELTTANAMGVVEDAPTFRFSREGDPITGDNLGAAIQAVVDRGGNLFIDMIFQELDLDAVLRAWWPYDPTSPTDLTPVRLGRIGTSTNRTIGRLTTTQELRARKILNVGDLTTDRYMTLLRFRQAQLAPGFDITQLLGSRHRNVPISFLCSPFLDGTDTAYWSVTEAPA